MDKKFYIVLFLILSIIFFSGMLLSETQKLNIQLKSNYQLEEEINQAYESLKVTNSSFIEKKIEFDEKILYKNQLIKEESSLLELQNSLNQEIILFRTYESKDPRIFVDVNDSKLLEILNQLINSSMNNSEKAEAIFNYTRDNISKEDTLIRNGRIDYWNYPKDIIENKKGGYEDKIILLISMLRASGFSNNEVEVVGAKISLIDSTSSDIWVEIKLGGDTYLLLPREKNNFDSFNKTEIYKLYDVQELFRFNDINLTGS